MRYWVRIKDLLGSDTRIEVQAQYTRPQWAAFTAVLHPAITDQLNKLFTIIGDSKVLKQRYQRD